ncbi:MAG: DMT family transporter [Candidatus Tectomicrobia bacterium]
MEAWVLFTIAAAFLQNIRNSLQKKVNSVLSTSGAAFTRFGFGLPLAMIYWFLLYTHDPQSLNFGVRFWVFVVLGATCQILAMVFLLRAFSLRGFAVGTAYAKTETLQTAVFSIILLGEAVSFAAFIAIIISFAGVLCLSTAKSDLTVREFLLSWTRKPALFGLGSGASLGLSGVGYRGASLALEGEGALLSAATTLMFALTIQVALMTPYLYCKESGQLTKIWQQRKTALIVGVASMLGSVGWFTAMTLINATYVRALGQVELLFTFLTSVFFFKEKITSHELLGTALIVGGLLVLLLG